MTEPDGPAPQPRRGAVSEGGALRPREWLGPLVLLVLITLTAAFGDAGRAALEFNRAGLADQQWWRLLTGNLVHATWYHWLLNALGLWIYVLLCPEPLALRWWLARLLIIGGVVGIGIWLWIPSVGIYWGLSGAQHGFYLLGFWHHLRRGDRLMWLAMAVLIGKLVWEIIGAAPVSNEAAIGAPVLTQSHLLGFLGGVGYLIIFGRVEKRSARLI